jgi:2-polyprenyl-3-methyl-5-hydroxy-6-metoxy-1,4-benzoquinol methylase
VDRDASVTKSNCRLCGKIDYTHIRIKNGFHLERCRSCSLVQITDDMSAVRLEELYDQAFFEEVYDWQHEGRGKRIAYEKLDDRLDEIERLVSGRGKMLEVGCAFGYFLDTARSRGWQTRGIELGDHAARFAREELELDVQTMSIEQAEFGPGEFDVIALWDVLEHLEDPLEQFRRLGQMLKKDGIVAFNTPDVDSAIARLQGRYWRNFVPPIHITYFGPRSIQRLLALTGFEPVEITVALPRERLLKQLRLYDLLRRWGVSDKLLVFARKSGD